MFTVTEAANEQIAIMIGWTKCNCSSVKPHYQYGSAHFQVVDVANMTFNESWDALMPVVKRVIKEDLGGKIPLSRPLYDKYKAIQTLSIHDDIKTVWKAIAEYAEAYNKEFKK